MTVYKSLMKKDGEPPTDGVGEVSRAGTSAGQGQCAQIPHHSHIGEKSNSILSHRDTSSPRHRFLIHISSIQMSVVISRGQPAIVRQTGRLSCMVENLNICSYAQNFQPNIQGSLIVLQSGSSTALTTTLSPPAF